jgi:hypothetical protein
LNCACPRRLAESVIESSTQEHPRSAMPSVISMRSPQQPPRCKHPCFLTDGKFLIAHTTPYVSRSQPEKPITANKNLLTLANSPYSCSPGFFHPAETYPSQITTLRSASEILVFSPQSRRPRLHTPHQTCGRDLASASLRAQMVYSDQYRWE